jgi:catalase
MMKPEEQQRLFENTARSIAPASQEVQLRHIGNCSKADPAYGAGVAAALGKLLRGRADLKPAAAD